MIGDTSLHLHAPLVLTHTFDVSRDSGAHSCGRPAETATRAARELEQACDPTVPVCWAAHSAIA